MIVRRLLYFLINLSVVLLQRNGGGKDCPRFPFVQQGYVVQEDLLNTIGVGGVHHGCQVSMDSVSYWMSFRGIPLF